VTSDAAAVATTAAGTRARVFASPFLWGALGLVVACGVAAGAASQPKLVLGAGAAACALVLAFRMPVLNLGVLLFLTAVVPFEVLNRFSVGGGINSPGLLASDLFLLAGLAWAVLALPTVPLDRRRYVYLLAMLVFLAAVALQTLHGLSLGYPRNVVGQEGRVLLGFGTFLIALPVLAHRASRHRLSVALVVVALLLGSWGMLQWVGHFTFGAAGDVGVRSGVRLTSGGVGQLQGGQFAFPVALIGCFAVLAFGGIRSRLSQSALVAAIALNAGCCLVTFERSFWIDALLGLAFVLVTGHSARRLKVLVAVVTVGLVALTALAVTSPTTVTTAKERLQSISSYGTDDSVRYRVVESHFVYQQIEARPLLGSGLGATIFWGQPWAKVPPKSHHYAHDGYFWLAWKVGVPAAVLLVTMLLLAPLSRARRDEEFLSIALRRGAQGAIVGLLLATITFPSFSQLGIAPAIGLLLAIAVSPELRAPRFPIRSRPQLATAASLT
jgi:O-Antigen ligase